MACVIRGSTRNKDLAKQVPIPGDLLPSAASARAYLLLITTIRQVLPLKLKFEHTQAHTKQSSLTHPYQQLLQLPFKPFLVDQMSP